MRSEHYLDEAPLKIASRAKGSFSCPVRAAPERADIPQCAGWLGGLAANLAFDITVATGRDPQTLRAAYLVMETIAIE
jgi:hypothetical protein